MGKRSIYLDGAVTSISMEDSFWHELDRMASAGGQAWADLVREWLKNAAPSENRSASIKETILSMLRNELERFHAQDAGIQATWEIAATRASAPIFLRTEGVRVIIGREPPAEIVIADTEISRRHAMLVTDGEHWWVIDLKSKNGTYLRGKKIQMAELALGAAISVGNTRIVLASYTTQQSQAKGHA
jgi:pSer/pThr/pTyr-binding forkhead associated (FHA) protein